MKFIDHKQIMETAQQQEELLRFDHFTNKDAWELGSLIVRRAAEHESLTLAVSIRKPNGNIVFQYCPDGTTLSNENWIRRKFNTVCLTETSSLRAWASSNYKNQDLAAQGLDAKDYALCGGGFPIKLKTGEMVAVLIVSNLPHMVDHSFAVGAVSEYLDMEYVVPRISVV